MGRRVFDARTTAALQRDVEDNFYGDTANILQDTVTSIDSHGQAVVTTVSTAVSCSFTDQPKLERWKDFADIEQISAEIRYAGTPAPAKGNRVTLAGRFDSTDYTDKTFEVIGIRDRGTMGVVVALMAATA